MKNIRRRGGALEIPTYIDPTTPGYASGNLNGSGPGHIFFDIGMYGLDLVNFLGPYIPEFGKFFNVLTDTLNGITNALFPAHTPLVLQLKAEGFDAFARDTYLLPYDQFASKSSQDYYRWNDKFYQYYGNIGKPDIYGNNHGFTWWYPPNVLVKDPATLISDQHTLEAIHQKIGSRILDQIAHPEKYPKEPTESGSGYNRRGSGYTQVQQNYLNTLSPLQKSSLRGATPAQIQRIIDESNANLMAQKQLDEQTAQQMKYQQMQSAQTQANNAQIIAQGQAEIKALKYDVSFPPDLDSFFITRDFRTLTKPIDDVYGHMKEKSNDQIKSLQIGTVNYKGANDTVILNFLHSYNVTQVLQSEATMPYYEVTGLSDNYRPAYYFLADANGTQVYNFLVKNNK